MKLTGWIFTVLISLLMCAFLELNHNTLIGWLLFLSAAAALVFCIRKYMGSWKWWQKGLSVLGYLALCLCIILVSWPPVRRVPASNSRNAAKTDVYETADGQVRGVVLDSGVELFAGIPYAAPPVGELRWKKPQDPEKWEGILECDAFAPMSMQVQNLPFIGSMAQILGYHDYRISLQDNYREANSEDSLYLNIWKPAGNVEKAPVAVYYPRRFSADRTAMVCGLQRGRLCEGRHHYGQYGLPPWCIRFSGNGRNAGGGRDSRKLRTARPDQST